MSNSPFITDSIQQFQDIFLDCYDTTTIVSPCSPISDSEGLSFVKSKNSGKVIMSKKFEENCISPYGMTDYNVLNRSYYEQPVSPLIGSLSPSFDDSHFTGDLASPVKTPPMMMDDEQKTIQFCGGNNLDQSGYDNDLVFTGQDFFQPVQPFFHNPITFETNPLSEHAVYFRSDSGINPLDSYFPEKVSFQQTNYNYMGGEGKDVVMVDKDVDVMEESSENESLGEGDSDYVDPSEQNQTSESDEMDCSSDDEEFMPVKSSRQGGNRKKNKIGNRNRNGRGQTVKFIDGIKRVVVHVGEKKTFRILNNLIYYRKSTMKVRLVCSRRVVPSNVNIYCHLEYKSYKRSSMANPRENRWKVCDYPGNQPTFNSGGVVRKKGGGKQKGLFVDYTFNNGNEIEISYCITFNVKEMCRNTGKNYVRVHFTVYFSECECTEVCVPMLWDTHGKPKGDDKPIRIKQMCCDVNEGGRIFYKLAKKGRICEVDDYEEDVEPILVRGS